MIALLICSGVPDSDRYWLCQRQIKESTCMLPAPKAQAFLLECFACMYVAIHAGLIPMNNWKRGSDSLEPELPWVKNCHFGTRNRFLVSCKRNKNFQLLTHLSSPYFSLLYLLLFSLKSPTMAAHPNSRFKKKNQHTGRSNIILSSLISFKNFII